MYNGAVTKGFVAARDRGVLERLIAGFGCEATGEQVAALGRFLELVSTWNAKLDLTAARETAALVEVMIADAVVLAANDFVSVGARCVDVGSGAGAPGLPLAMLRSDIALVMVEPLRKRVAFLRTAIGRLQLAARVQVLERKIDPAAPLLPEDSFDVALSRATFAPELWLPTGLALAPRTLVLLAGQPLPAAENAVLERELSYALPTSGATRRIASYRRG